MSRPEHLVLGAGHVRGPTGADGLGRTAPLVGMCREPAIRNVPTARVSNRSSRLAGEHDAARRAMSAALPVGCGRALRARHDKRPFARPPDENVALAGDDRDASYRIAVAQDGISDRGSHRTGTDAMAFFPDPSVESDGAQADATAFEAAGPSGAKPPHPRHAGTESARAAGRLVPDERN